MAICESFLREIWGRGILWCGKSKAIPKGFLRKNRIFQQVAKAFSLESFPLYGMLESVTETGLGEMIWAGCIGFHSTEL